MKVFYQKDEIIVYTDDVKAIGYDNNTHSYILRFENRDTLYNVKCNSSITLGKSIFINKMKGDIINLL